MITFAQLPDAGSAQGIGWLCLGLFALAAGARQIIGIVRDLRPRPDAHEVQADTRDRYVSREAFAAQNEAISTRFSGLESFIREQRSESRQGFSDLQLAINRVHQRLDPMVEAVARHDGQLNSKP